MATGSGYGAINLPRVCTSSNPGPDKQKCPLDSYAIVSDRCQYIDQ